MDEEIIRVFLVDDDEDDYVLTRDLLAEAEGACFELEWVDTYEAALEAMGRAEHDVYLVDYRLGERDGLELLHAAIGGGCQTPIIMLTGQGDHAVDMAAMKAGAADYLDKGELSAPLLERCIRYAIERKQAEEALRESEGRFRRLAENAQDLIYRYEFTPQRGFTYVSPAATAITGYTPEEHYADPDLGLKLVHPDDRPLLEQYFQGGGVFREPIVLRWTRKDGTVIWTEQRNVPIYDEAGNLAALEGIARDITERKRAEEELRQSYVQLQRALEGTVNTLVSAIEIRDPYTGGHQRRVTQLACAIANEMGLPEEQIEGIRMAGLIHDVGKISIPAEILGKPGGLNAIEYGLIKSHSRIGHDILKAVEFPWPLAQIVLQHHERMNGAGYPQGLSGEEIILEARILGVADVVEAMVSHRPYRPAHSIDEALEEISQNRGRLYDAEVVDACLKLFSEDRFTFE